MNFFVIGCGRVGSELAFRLYKNGHKVVVIDKNREALNGLPPEFRGRIIEGDVLAEQMLERAGIAEADGIAIVTNSDTLNAVVGHMARTIYRVPIIVTRNYDPVMLPVLQAFGCNVVSSTSWGAQRIQELLLDPSFRSIFSAGNGEVEIYEMLVPLAWDGKPLGDLLRDNPDCLPVALTRAGRALLPNTETGLQAGDMLNVSATFAGIKALRLHLDSGAEV
ncbi:MAG: TrkA family potassium uptake protein [Anaerolineales bacterium]|nr:TrkA family potassium uptake protein [Anaerolineales bacterium]